MKGSALVPVSVAAARRQAPDPASPPAAATAAPQDNPAHIPSHMNVFIWPSPVLLLTSLLFFFTVHCKLITIIEILEIEFRQYHGELFLFQTVGPYLQVTAHDDGEGNVLWLNFPFVLSCPFWALLLVIKPDHHTVVEALPALLSAQSFRFYTTANLRRVQKRVKFHSGFLCENVLYTMPIK